MSGKHITEQQVRLYMNGRKQGQTQVQAGAKAGISERTGQRIDSGQVSARENQERHWRTREDPFEEVWDSEVAHGEAPAHRHWRGDACLTCALTAPTLATTTVNECAAPTSKGRATFLQPGGRVRQSGRARRRYWSLQAARSTRCANLFGLGVPVDRVVPVPGIAYLPAGS